MYTAIREGGKKGDFLALQRATIMYLMETNNTKENSKDIVLSKLKEYFQKNKNTEIMKTIFNTKSKTLELKKK